MEIVGAVSPFVGSSGWAEFGGLAVLWKWRGGNRIVYEVMRGNCTREQTLMPPRRPQMLHQLQTSPPPFPLLHQRTKSVPHSESQRMPTCTEILPRSSWQEQFNPHPGPSLRCTLVLSSYQTMFTFSYFLRRGILVHVFGL